MLTDAELKAALKQRAVAAGFLDCGVSGAALGQEAGALLEGWLQAGMHGEMDYMYRHGLARGQGVEHVLPGAQSVLVFAAAYKDGRREADVAEESGQKLRVAGYATGEDYHYVLREKLQPIADWLAVERPGHNWRICVDSAPISERAYAVAAGLGFIGRNGMLINWLKGSYTLLAEILTTAAIDPDAPRAGTCGQCTRCIDACPTDAIVAPGQVDARKCISYLTIEKKTELTVAEMAATREWAFGCDICQDVCPYNKEPAVLQMAELGRKVVEAVEDPATFLDAESNRHFERRFARSPLLRPGRRRIRRLISWKLQKE